MYTIYNTHSPPCPQFAPFGLNRKNFGCLDLTRFFFLRKNFGCLDLTRFFFLRKNFGCLGLTRFFFLRKNFGCLGLTRFFFLRKNFGCLDLIRFFFLRKNFGCNALSGRCCCQASQCCLFIASVHTLGDFSHGIHAFIHRNHGPHPRDSYLRRRK